jgi:hypothetical protein
LDPPEPNSSGDPLSTWPAPCLEAVSLLPEQALVSAKAPRKPTAKNDERMIDFTPTRRLAMHEHFRAGER